MQNLNEIEELIKLISKLPGLGPKSAKRIILKLINNRDELVKPMAKVFVDIYKNVSRCNICGTLKSKNELGLCLIRYISINLAGDSENLSIRLY